MILESSVNSGIDRLRLLEDHPMPVPSLRYRGRACSLVGDLQDPGPIHQRWLDAQLPPVPLAPDELDERHAVEDERRRQEASAQAATLAGAVDPGRARGHERRSLPYRCCHVPIPPPTGAHRAAATMRRAARS